MSKLIVSAKPTGVFRYGPASRSRNRNRNRIGPTRRRAIYERDGYRCVRCGSSRDLTLDHDVPLAKGGTNEDDNLLTMCAACNEWKADRFV